MATMMSSYWVLLASRSASQPRGCAGACCGRREVQWNALPDRALVGLVFGGADLHRAVERPGRRRPPVEGSRPRSEAVIAFEHAAAEDLTGDFDLLRQRDFLLGGEQRNLAHLRQVHAYRIVDALGAGSASSCRGSDRFLLRLLRKIGFIFAGDLGLAISGLPLVTPVAVTAS